MFRKSAGSMISPFNSKFFLQSSLRVVIVFAVLLAVVVSVLNFQPARAATTLTVEPITWNVIGLDSNNVNVGPQNFPVGVRVCNTGSSVATDVTATFVWDSANTYINIRPGTSNTLVEPTPAAGACTDFYFEVQVTRNPAAYDTARSYHIEVTESDAPGTIWSTPTPRELYVEHLISQSRNSTKDIRISTTGAPGSYTSVPPNGLMTLFVGNTYWIELTGFTATNGYEQIETFINMPNTIFQILDVDTTYTAPPSGTKDMLYADGCTWVNNPLSPNYRSCMATGKYGGDISVTYQVKIISAPISPLLNPEALHALTYDFSGSSYHYNADFSTSVRYAEIADPTTITIAKKFSPDPIGIGGVSALTFTITNPYSTSISNVNFVDVFPTSPGAMTVASPLTTSNSCGGTLQDSGGGSLADGDAGIKLINGILPANGFCSITVNVTAPITGTYPNTSNNLFIGSTDTGDSATATLTVSTAPTPPTPTCGIILASFLMNTSEGTGVPPSYTFKSDNVDFATVSYTSGGRGVETINTTRAGSISGVNSYATSGYWPTGTAMSATLAPYVEFYLDTSHFTDVAISFNRDPETGGDWGNPADNLLYVYSQADSNSGTWSTIVDGKESTKTIWTFLDATPAAATGTTSTYFRVNINGATKTTGELLLDDIIFTGCGLPQPPTVTKTFSPSTVAVNSTSTLTFTITNPNTEPNAVLTGINLSDFLPHTDLQGTVAITQNETTVTGTGTSFKTQLVPGSVLAIPSTPVNLSGTVAVTQGSFYVTGTDTLFTSELAIGTGMVINSVEYQVSDIIDDTHLLLAYKYIGTDAGGLTASAHKMYTVSTITSDTSLTLTSNYLGTTASDLTISSGLDLAAAPTSNCRGAIIGTAGRFAISLEGDRLNGTIAVTNGSPSVVGTNTLFMTQLSVGSRIRIDGVFYKVATITDNTHLTLNANYTGAYYLGATASGLAYGYYTTSPAGTVQVQFNKKAVIGTGTAFTTQFVPGDIVYIKVLPYVIAGITDDTHLTLTNNYTGVDESDLKVYADYVLEGTVATTSGSPIVTGTGTYFKEELAPTSVIYINSVPYTVLSVTSDTSLTLTTNATSTQSGVKVSQSGRLGLVGLAGGSSASCTITATVHASMAGANNNVSGFIAAAESGVNTTASGFAIANLDAVLPPVISKVFAPGTIPSGGTSILTFMITNPNQNNSISSVAFSDTYPDNVTNTNPAVSSTTCTAGSVTASDGGSSVSLSGASLAAGASCVVTVNVTSSTLTGNLSGTLSVINGSTSVTGLGTSFLTQLAVGDYIYIEGTSYKVAAIASATSMTLATPYTGATASGLTVPNGYHNTSGNVSHVINGVTVNGNSAKATLMVKAPIPGISLMKQVGASATGPWYDSVIIPAGSTVYYKFTVENTGDVALSPVSVNDPTVSTAGCTWPASLPVAVAANELHIATCIVNVPTPIIAAAGYTTNTARAQGTYGGTVYYSNYDSASYLNGNFGHLPSAYQNMNLYNDGGAMNVNGTTYLGTRLPGLGADPGEADGINMTNYVPQATDDGVTWTGSWNSGTGTASVVVTCDPGGSKTLYGWFDWNNNTDFGDALEAQSWSVPCSPTGTTSSITIDYPGDGNLAEGTFYARFRIYATDPGTASPLGASSIAGEIEDYFITADGGGTPTPITLSYFKAERQGEQVLFNWSTATETGNIGFNIYVGSGNKLKLVNQELIPSHVVDSLERQDYSFTAKVGGTVFYIEDVDVYGGTRRHGPFTPGQEFGSTIEMEPINWRVVENGLRSADVPGLRQSKAAVPVKALNLGVRQTGLYRITYEMLRDAGLDLKGARSAAISVTQGGRAVPVYVLSTKGKFGPGSFMEFYGKALDTPYTDVNIYTIQLSRTRSPLIPVNNTPLSRKAKLAASYLETLLVNEQRAYANSAPGADTWYDTKMLVYTTPKTWNFQFNVDGLADPSAPAALNLVVWGVTDWPQSPDHHLRASVNGVPVADLTFNGLTEQVLNVSLPGGTLREGANTLQLTLPGDTGVKYDMVNLDRFSVTYNRLFNARDGRLTFTAAGSAFQVNNLPSRNVVVYQVDKDRTVRIGRVAVKASGDTYTATFPGSFREYTYLVSTVESLYAPSASETPAQANLDVQAQYLVISHPSFIDGIQPLVQARRAQGLTVNVVDVNDLYARYTYGVFDPKAIQDYIAHAARNLGTQYVLLVGGDTYDYRNYLGVNSISFIPSLYVTTSDVAKFVPADPLYADYTGDNVPDLAIGRFPVRTVAELELMVNKTLAYQNKDYGRTAVFASDKLDGSISFRNSSNSMSATLPSSWSVQNIHLDELSVSAAQAGLLSAMNNGTALVNFTGHSGPTAWTFSGLFNMRNAAALTNAGRPFVVAQWGCWNTYYVDPVNNYLVQSFLFSGDRGAAAVLGASTLTDSLSEELLGELLTPRLVSPGMTLGQALLDAKQALALDHPDLLDVLLGWTLMGDPALVIEP